MSRKQSHKERISMSFINFILLFLFLCIICSTTIIGSTKGEMNPYIASIITLFSFLGILILALEAKEHDNESRKQLANKLVKEENTANNQHYHRFSREKDGYVTFDSNGYIVEAKGFGSLMWSTSMNIDKDLIGKHVDELAEMLKEYGANPKVYSNFEKQVHIKLLKEIRKC